MFRLIHVYSGLRLRTEDYQLTPSRQRQLLKQRRMLTVEGFGGKESTTIRKGDSKEDRRKILAERRPVQLKLEDVTVSYRADQPLSPQSQQHVTKPLSPSAQEYTNTPYTIGIKGGKPEVVVQKREIKLLEKGEFIKFAQTLAPNQPISYSQLKGDLLQALKALTDREQTVLRLSFGIDCLPVRAIDIAAKMDVTSERIRFITSKAISKLRGLNSHRVNQLLSMIDDIRLPFKVSKRAAIVGLPLTDGKALAKELNQKYPGRKFRVPTYLELIEIGRLLADQIECRNDYDYIWSDTEDGRYKDEFIIVRLANQEAARANIRESCYNIAVLLIEDK